MGLFDKLKHFAGGHGVEVKITRLERQDPENATFPLSDSVMKFNVEITGQKEVTVLSHDFEVYAERTSEENPRIIQVASDSHDKDTDIIGGDVKWPYTLTPGQVIKDGCCIGDVDLRKALANMDVDDPEAVLSDPEYSFFVKFTADVKGSPMDPEAKAKFSVTA